MKRLAPLALILLFVVCSTGCRRGLRLWGLRGAPCQPAGPIAPGLGGGPYGGGVLGGPQMPMGAPMASPTCCPPVDCCPPAVECGCATQGLSADPAYLGSVGGQIPMSGPMIPDGTEVLLSDSGTPLQRGEWLGPGSNAGTATSVPPASVPPMLPSR